MRAGVVTPGTDGSARLVTLPEPEVRAGDVLVRTLAIGVCGTDREIASGSYGMAPDGDDYLILGHESLGEVETAPKGSGLSPGDLVVAVVRRPCPELCPPCARGHWDMCLTGDYTERGIKGAHGYLCAHYVEHPEYLVALDPSLRDIGVLLEPTSVVEKAIEQVFLAQQRMVWQPRHAVVLGCGPIGLLSALILRTRGLEVTLCDLAPDDDPKAQLARAMGATYACLKEQSLTERAKNLAPIDVAVEATGYSPLMVEAANNLGPDGALCLTAVTGGHRPVNVDLNVLNGSLVLENHIIIGSVNANRHHFELGAEHLKLWKERFPKAIEGIITRKVPMDSWTDGLKPSEGDIKTIITLA